MSGKVFFVGAGPGDPDLLTLRALAILQQADVVLHDDLVTPEILSLVRTPRVMSVGKRCGAKRMAQEAIHELMIAHAGKGLDVARLKGGDPLVFARAGEEMEALRAAGVAFEVVPGITSAVAAAAAAGISLTDRRMASQVAFTTLRRGEPDLIPWTNSVERTTLVIYMPGSDYARVAKQLKSAGFADNMPCTVISNAARRSQKIVTMELAALAFQGALPAPSVIVVGRVARAAAGKRSESELYRRCAPARPYFLEDDRTLLGAIHGISRDVSQVVRSVGLGDEIWLLGAC